MEYLTIGLAILVILVLGFFIAITCISDYRQGYREKDAGHVILPRLSSPAPEIQKGFCFEQFVVSRFAPAYFKLKAWCGDKHFQNIYPESNQYPDLVYEYHSGSTAVSFAVECKWRAKFFQNKVLFSRSSQLGNYRSYAQEKRLPVFLVIGIGGSEFHPRQCYTVPLHEIPENFSFLSAGFLRSYQRPEPEKMFFLDWGKMELR